MGEEKERELARVTNVDIIIEDHGIPALSAGFEYEGCSAQGLGLYTLDGTFVFRFMLALGVTSLKSAVGKSCWITHDHSNIYAIEPLHKKDGTPFIIADWQEWVKTKPGISAYEMRTGKKP